MASTAASANVAAAEHDVAYYLKGIEDVIRRYRNLLERARRLAKARSKKAAVERGDVLVERKEIKADFIRAKQTCRALFQLLPPELGTARRAQLADLQAEFRDIDGDFKSLALQSEREAMGLPADLDVAGEPGAAASGGVELTVGGTGMAALAAAGGARSIAGSSASGIASGPGGAGMGTAGGAAGNGVAANNELLSGALGTAQQATQQLKEGLATLNTTQATGAAVGTALAADREKLQRISAGLDEVHGELAVARRLLVTLLKSLYTDKVIIAVTFLIVAGIVAIIVYSTTHPNQTAFRTPDVVKPPIAPRGLAGSLWDSVDGLGSPDAGASLSVTGSSSSSPTAPATALGDRPGSTPSQAGSVLAEAYRRLARALRSGASARHGSS